MELEALIHQLRAKNVDDRMMAAEELSLLGEEARPMAVELVRHVMPAMRNPSRSIPSCKNLTKRSSFCAMGMSACKSSAAWPICPAMSRPYQGQPDQCQQQQQPPELGDRVARTDKEHQRSGHGCVQLDKYLLKVWHDHNRTSRIPNPSVPARLHSADPPFRTG